MAIKKNVPELRFPGFSGEWEKKKLLEIVKRIVRKNKDNETSRVLTISANMGLIDQEIYFNKRVASKNIEGYYLLRKGEFAYNKSYSKGFPFGAIKQLTIYDDGAVSTLYICFKVKDDISKIFIKKYFDSVAWHRGISTIAVEGARNHGLLNIMVNDFFETIHYVPSLQEQTKIANFFTLIDEKIEKQQDKVTNLEDYKKGMMQKIFSQEIRFKDKNGEDYPEWEEKKLGELSDVRDGTHDSPKYIDVGYPFITSKNLLENGQIDFEDISFISEQDFIQINKRSKVDKGDILFGMIGTIGNPVMVNNDGFAIKNVALIKEGTTLKNDYLLQFLKSTIIDSQFYILNTGGTQKFIGLGTIRDLVILTPSLLEQIKIANLLSSIDLKISKEKEKLETIKELKKGLMQKMFI